MEVKEFFESFPADLVFKSLEEELNRRLSKALRTVKAMEEKYGMTLKEFENRKVLKKLNYSWEVEKDYIDWDRAESEIKFCREKLKELQSWKSSQLQKH